MQGKKLIKSGILFIIVMAIVVAFFQVTEIKDVDDLMVYLRYKSKEIDQCINKSFDTGQIECSWFLNLTPTTKNTIKNETGKSFGNNSNNQEINNSGNQNNNNTIVETGNEYLDKLNLLPVISKVNDVAYARADWKHWINIEGSSCWNVREEVLYKSAKEDTVVFLDKDNKITTDKNKACSIKSGEWYDPYSGETFADPAKVDIDHHIPLKRANATGGDSWDKATKQQYANDVDVLVATSAKQNRSKGAKGIGEWLPPLESAHCEYAQRYVNIATKYHLSITEDDKVAIINALETCEVKQNETY